MYSLDGQDAMQSIGAPPKQCLERKAKDIFVLGYPWCGFVLCESLAVKFWLIQRTKIILGPNRFHIEVKLKIVFQMLFLNGDSNCFCELGVEL